jgi:hypothetical protein
MPDDPHQAEESPSAGVQGALRSLYGRAPGIPAAVDDTILARAQRELAARRRFRRWATGLKAGAGLAAAAALALAAWLWTPHAGSEGGNLAAREDMDGDGRVDIVDALHLARSIASGGASAGDMNGDGRVDHADVDAIAARAVRLDGGAM